MAGARSGFGVASVVIVAALAVVVGGGVVFIPKLLRSKAVTATTSASNSATDLEPIEHETTFASPLSSAGAAASANAQSTQSTADAKHGGKGATGSVNVSSAGPNARGQANANASGNPAQKGAKTGASASGANAASTPPLPSFTASPAQTDPAPAAFNPVNAHVEIGLITASGVDEGAVKGLMQTSKSKLNACYRDALAAAGQRIDGTATVSLSIDASALVSGVAVTGIEKLPQASRCFQTALFHRQLPATSVQGGAATAEVWTPLKPE